MHNIGQFSGKDVYWLDYAHASDSMPARDWICLAMARTPPESAPFAAFAQACIQHALLEFKAQGDYASVMHDLFQQTLCDALIAKQATVNTAVNFNPRQSVAAMLWDCFFAVSLPETTNAEDVQIVCTDLDGNDRSAGIKQYLQDFEEGWIPAQNLKHEIWESPEGLTSLCVGNKQGDGCRALLEPGSKLVHIFYAFSHYEAMSIYYRYMHWGDYVAEYASDKVPYTKWYGDLE